MRVLALATWLLPSIISQQIDSKSANEVLKRRPRGFLGFSSNKEECVEHFCGYEEYDEFVENFVGKENTIKISRLYQIYKGIHQTHFEKRKWQIRRLLPGIREERGVR